MRHGGGMRRQNEARRRQNEARRRHEEAIGGREEAGGVKRAALCLNSIIKGCRGGKAWRGGGAYNIDPQRYRSLNVSR